MSRSWSAVARVQVPSSQHLRPQNGFEALPTLVPERGVGQHANAVNHAGERRQLPIHPREHFVHRGGVRHIGEFDLDPEPAGA